jgi:hypothetical protein
MTEYGWTWVSDWDWGWAPFHYGRWLTIGGYGWCWVPGTIWGPAWVSWRYGGGYAGWAPLPPPGVTVGPPRGVRSPWHFVVAGQLGATRPAYVPYHVMPSVFARTSVVTNVRTMPGAGLSAHINAGPVIPGVAVARAASLRAVAPTALPRVSITPHAGQPVASRPWVQSRPFGGPAPSRAMPLGRVPAPSRGIPIGPRPTGVTPQPVRINAQPVPRASYAPRPYAPAYGAAYRAPVPLARPQYAAPHYSAPVYHYSAPSYSAPHYSAPAYHYSAPSYSAPSAPHYSAPAFQSAPSYSAPHYSAPSFHSAPSFGGHGGFGGGGHRR